MHSPSQDDIIQTLNIILDSLSSNECMTTDDPVLTKIRASVEQELESHLIQKADAALVLRGVHLAEHDVSNKDPAPMEAIDRLVKTFVTDAASRKELKDEIAKAEWSEDDLDWSLHRNPTVRRMHDTYNEVMRQLETL